jgi:hypothetical protein
VSNRVAGGAPLVPLRDGGVAQHGPVHADEGGR